MNRLYEFWQRYSFPESNEEGVKHYHGLHPDDLDFLKEHYPYLFDHPVKYKSRKQKEIIKFQQWMHQINGRYESGIKQTLIYNEQSINIAVPDAYHGNMEEAKLLILLINPKYDPKTAQNEWQKKCIYNNLQQEKSNFAPCEFIDGKVNTDNIPNWWYERMFCHIEEEIGAVIHQNAMMAVQYLPYRSFQRKDVPEFKTLFPSQQTAVTAVKEAMAKKISIIVRGTDRTRWFEALPELKDYPDLYVFTNYKHPTLCSYETMKYTTYMNQEILKLSGELKRTRDDDWQQLVNVFKE